MSCSTPDVVGNDDTSIRTVLNSVAADDTITICDGVYAITQTLSIDDSIAIQGQSTQGTILDGGGATQIMRVIDPAINVSDGAEPRLLITDITLRNGNTGSNGTDYCNTRSQCGGAIYVEDEAQLTVKRAHFEGNRASYLGGAIANNGNAGLPTPTDYTGGSIRIEDSTFYRNTSTIDGGAVAYTYNTTYLLTIINSTFVENEAVRRNGGAINVSFSYGTVSSSTFVNNRASRAWTLWGHGLTVNGSLIASTSSSAPCASEPPTADATTLSTGTGCGDAQIVTLDSLQLRGLGYWGGPTMTEWIGPGSSAYRANTGTCPSLDQRGVSRGAAPCDSGAFQRIGNTDEGTSGFLDYAPSVYVDDTSSPITSPEPDPTVMGRTIGYMPSTTSTCSVDSQTGVATALAAGDCGVRWYLAPTTGADGAADDDSLTVVKRAQDPLTIDPLPEPLVYGSTTPLSTSGGSGSGAVTYGVGDSSACVIVSGANLRVTAGTGTCTVTATKATSSTYEAATSPPISPQVAKAQQAALTLTAATQAYVGSDVPLATSGGTTNGDVTYATTSPDVCSVVGSTARLNTSGTCLVSATMAGDSNYLPVASATVAVAATRPPIPIAPPSPPSPPLGVSATVTAGKVRVTWLPPSSPGSYPITSYMVSSSPEGSTCLVQAPETSCEVTGLTEGVPYRFTVQALNGAGWSAPSTPSPAIEMEKPVPASMLIVGTRAGKRVNVTISTTGVPQGTVLYPWIKKSSRVGFEKGKSSVTVTGSGPLSWTRLSNRGFVLYFATSTPVVRSNTITLPSH